MRRVFVGIAILLLVSATPSHAQDAGPVPHTPCSGADALLAVGDKASAKARYTKILAAKDVTPEAVACAHAGLTTIKTGEPSGVPQSEADACAEAYELAGRHRTEEARKAFTALADSATHSTTKRCARTGLERLEPIETRIARYIPEWFDLMVPGDWPPFASGLWIPILFLVVLTAFVTRRVRGALGDRDPSPVEIKQVLDEKGAASATAQARLGQTLLTLGAPPPAALPNGSLADAIAEIIEALAPQARGAVAKTLTKFGRRIVPPGGFFVDAALHARDTEPKVGITVQVRRRRNSALIGNALIWSKTADQALDDAAGFIYQRILSQPRVSRGVPPWARWTTYRGKSVLAYQAAYTTHFRDYNPDSALRNYESAAKMEPENVLIKQALGTALGELDRPAEALIPYLASVRLAPVLPDSWYNLAITYATLAECEPFDKHPLVLLAASQPGKLRVIRRLIEDVHPGHRLPLLDASNAPLLKHTLYDLAEHAWDKVRRQFSLSATVGKDLHRRTRPLVTGMSFPFSRVRFGYRVSARAMWHATRLKKARQSGLTETLEQRSNETRKWCRRQRARSWWWHRTARSEANYNIACAWALTELPAVDRSVNALVRSFNSDLQDFGEELDWAEQDKDLESLRKPHQAPAYAAWIAGLDRSPVLPTGSKDTRKALADQAALHIETWAARIRGFDRAKRIDIVRWAEGEHDTWKVVKANQPALVADDVADGVSIEETPAELIAAWARREAAAASAISRGEDIDPRIARFWASSAMSVWIALRHWARDPDQDGATLLKEVVLTAITEP